MTAGDRTIKVWHINTQTRKVLGTSVKVGKLKRSINSMIIDEKDEEAYCGTTSGDIVRVRYNKQYIFNSILLSNFNGYY